MREDVGKPAVEKPQLVQGVHRPISRRDQAHPPQTRRDDLTRPPAASQRGEDIGQQHRQPDDHILFPDQRSDKDAERRHGQGKNGEDEQGQRKTPQVEPEEDLADNDEH